LTLIILIPLLFAFRTTFCRHVIVTGSMLPLGYESYVTNGNEKHMVLAWNTCFAHFGC